MSDYIWDLFAVADAAQKQAEAIELEGPIGKLEKTSIAVAKAWSGSPLGYHANVYVEGLRPPRPGEHFSMEWGLMDRYSNETSGYVEYDPEEVKQHILKAAGNPDLEPFRQTLVNALRELRSLKAAAKSALSVALEKRSDSYLVAEAKELNGVEALSEQDAARALVPGGDLISRDSTAAHQGRRIAPHQQLLALPVALRSAKNELETVARIARQCGQHLQRKQGAAGARTKGAGSRIFIGHGRLASWRDLKDFISERLRLEYDEFNRVPVAGMTNIVRLSEMLDHAAFAFLVLTAEDELADGEVQARMNVIHEVGLFQGRLGFEKAIVLLEDGCREFSNVAGLGQIRFPKGNIKQTFEEVRRVLEREELIAP